MGSGLMLCACSRRCLFHREDLDHNMAHRLIPLLLAVGLLTGCQTTSSTSPDSVWYELPTGSKLVLNQDLEIPAGQAHTIVQDAKPGTSAYKLEVMCRFTVEQLGPRTIRPDTFLITEVSQGRQWVNEPSTMLFYKDLHLKSEQQQAILPMRCGYTWDPLLGQPVTIEQIRETLGSVFTLVTGPAGGNPQ
jgi:hypothetical protein